MNPAYISAFAALAGAAIGGLTSFGTVWLTQRAQLRNAHREAERAKLEALYNDFITEAARLFGDSLTYQTDDINQYDTALRADRSYAPSTGPGSDRCGRAVEDNILETYLGRNRTLHELRDFAHKGGVIREWFVPFDVEIAKQWNKKIFSRGLKLECHFSKRQVRSTNSR